MEYLPNPTLDHLEPKTRSVPLKETLDNENPIRIAILYEGKRQICTWVSDNDDQIRMKLNNNYEDVILPLLTDDTSLSTSDYVTEHRYRRINLLWVDLIKLYLTWRHRPQNFLLL